VGFIPLWSKDPSKGQRPINTKSETAFDSRMWKGAIAHHRCLVPARGFYGVEADKRPLEVRYFIHPKDQALFAFAGIYSVWHDVEQTAVQLFHHGVTVLFRAKHTLSRE